MGQYLTVKDLILELANYHWPGNPKHPQGYQAKVMVVDPKNSASYNTVTPAGWVSDHEYNEGVSSSPIIMPGPLPGGWKNSCHDHPYRRMDGLKKLRQLVNDEIAMCQREMVMEDIKLGRIEAPKRKE